MVSKDVSALIIAPRGRLRDSLGVLLRARDEISVVRESDDPAEGLVAIAERPPTMVLLDVTVADEQAWSLLRQLKTTWPRISCGVVVHTTEHERQARLTGADAILRAGFPAEDLDRTITGFIARSVGQLGPSD
jgi:DNA-binding NarL/FixJ family response regulator